MLFQPHPVGLAATCLTCFREALLRASAAEALRGFVVRAGGSHRSLLAAVVLVNADFLEALSPAAAQPAAEKTGVRTVPVVAAVGAAIAASAETTDATGKLSSALYVRWLPAWVPTLFCSPTFHCHKSFVLFAGSPDCLALFLYGSRTFISPIDVFLLLRASLSERCLVAMVSATIFFAAPFFLFFRLWPPRCTKTSLKEVLRVVAIVEAGAKLSPDTRLVGAGRCLCWGFRSKLPGLLFRGASHRHKHRWHR